MSESRFTPGPWRCEIDDDTQEPRIYAPQRENKLREQLICAVGHCREELETSEPTARLIAAAPELYEALRNLLALCESPNVDFSNGVTAGIGHPDEGDHWASVYIDAARAALLKATPEQSS